MQTAKTLIILGGCPGWSESSQSDQRLRWAHMPFCWFCHEMAYIKSRNTTKPAWWSFGPLSSQQRLIRLGRSHGWSESWSFWLALPCSHSITNGRRWETASPSLISSWKFSNISVLKSQKTYDPGHEKMCLMSYANNKGADQTANPHSLISAFVVRCLDSIISLDSIAEISRLLASFCGCAGWFVSGRVGKTCFLVTRLTF